MTWPRFAQKQVCISSYQVHRYVPVLDMVVDFCLSPPQKKKVQQVQVLSFWAFGCALWVSVCVCAWTCLDVSAPCMSRIFFSSNLKTCRIAHGGLGLQPVPAMSFQSPHIPSSHLPEYIPYVGLVVLVVVQLFDGKGRTFARENPKSSANSGAIAELPPDK